MANPEGSREFNPEQLVDRAQREADILVNDATAGDWLEVSASEMEVAMHQAKDALTGENIDEILNKIGEAEGLYLAAKERGEVPEDRVAMIEKLFENLKVS